MKRRRSTTGRDKQSRWEEWEFTRQKDSEQGGKGDTYAAWEVGYFHVASGLVSVDLYKLDQANMNPGNEEVLVESAQTAMWQEADHNAEHWCPLCGMNGMGQNGSRTMPTIARSKVRSAAKLGKQMSAR